MNRILLSAGTLRYTPKQKQIEAFEWRYLKQVEWCLTNEKDKLIKLLRTKEEIACHWKTLFNRVDKKQQSGTMARGAERVLASLFPNTWRPNSTPIGSDFMFETVDAMIHIDIKTAKYENAADHSGKIPIGLNQTSYYDENSGFRGNLPTRYTIRRDDQNQSKLCITYAIQIVFFEKNQEIICVVLVCIPNGELHPLYHDNVVDKGKSKGKSIRYRYGDQLFGALAGKKERYSIIYQDPERAKEVKSVISLFQ